MFNKTFLNSKLIFKTNNMKVNSFQAYSNFMNNVFHQTMFKIMTIGSFKSNNLQQLMNASGSPCITNIENSFLSNCIKDHSFMQLLKVFSGLSEFAVYKYLAGNIYINNLEQNLRRVSDVCPGTKPTLWYRITQ
jgi:valyl-tRNA synthetase